MLLVVAGLEQAAIADRTRRLAGSDWSLFPPAEQRTHAYARKLSRIPWELTVGDYETLVTVFGPDQSLAIFWWLFRGLYMGTETVAGAFFKVFQARPILFDSLFQVRGAANTYGLRFDRRQRLRYGFETASSNSIRTGPNSPPLRDTFSNSRAR